MKRILLFSLALTLLSSCTLKKQQNYQSVDADTLITKLAQYDGQFIQTEATIAHVCGVDFKKIKLKSDDGQIIKVISNDTTETFDKALTKNRVIVQGKILHTKLFRSEIEQTKKQKKLLCHVDHKPCKDKEWIERQEKQGHASTILEREYNKLIQIMEQTGKDYVSVPIIELDNMQLVSE